MSNTYYDPGTARGARVNELFTAIAPRYDAVNDLQSFGLHRRWKARLIGLLEAKRGQLALDVCCGTGDIALRLAESGVDVMGVDFNASMLSIARGRAAGRRLTGAGERGFGVREAGRISFVMADGQRLPFEDGTFDLATVGYGLRNMLDWRSGLGEMWRVLRAGGRLAVLDFGKPPNAVWRELYFAYLRCLVPLVGLTVCGNASAYAYILESLKHFPAQTGIDRWLRDQDARDVRLVNLVGGAMSINLGVKPA